VSFLSHLPIYMCSCLARFRDFALPVGDLIASSRATQEVSFSALYSCGNGGCKIWIKFRMKKNRLVAPGNQRSSLASICVVNYCVGTKILVPRGGWTCTALLVAAVDLHNIRLGVPVSQRSLWLLTARSSSAQRLSCTFWVRKFGLPLVLSASGPLSTASLRKVSGKWYLQENHFSRPCAPSCFQATDH